MEDTTRYSVTEHAVFSANYGYTLTYSVRLPDVQQVPGAATRYLETVAGRRRAWRSRYAAQQVANSMNVVFERAMGNLTAEATQQAAERQRAHDAHEGLDFGVKMHHGRVSSHNDGHGNVVLRFPNPLKAATWVAQWDLEREAVQVGDMGAYDQPVDVTLPFAAWMQAAGF